MLVLGHTACGAIKGAIDDVEMGHLTGLLARVKPAIKATVYADKRSSNNDAYVDAVARTNVQHATGVIRQRSNILADLEKNGSLKIVGAMYDIATGDSDLCELKRDDTLRRGSPRCFFKGSSAVRMQNHCTSLLKT